MLKKMAIALLALSTFVDAQAFPRIGKHATSTTSAAAQSSPTISEDCNTHKIAGSYANASVSVSLPLPDGSNTDPAALLLQLNMHDDGTADTYQTFSLDFPMNTGTNSPPIGSWKCREDGKLVVTVIFGFYGYDPAFAAAHPSLLPDILIMGYLRQTYLFSVQDNDTLNQVALRNRVYGPNEDPTNPQGGFLQPIDTTTVVYKRVEASDADLKLP